MIKKGDKLIPRETFRYNYDISENEEVEVVEYDGDIASLTWGEKGRYIGHIDFLKEFYVFDNINDELRKLLELYELKEAVVTTLEGKQIEVKLK